MKRYRLKNAALQKKLDEVSHGDFSLMLPTCYELSKASKGVNAAYVPYHDHVDLDRSGKPRARVAQIPLEDIEVIEE